MTEYEKCQAALVKLELTFNEKDDIKKSENKKAKRFFRKAYKLIRICGSLTAIYRFIENIREIVE